MFQVFGCIFYISICLGSYWWQCKLNCLWWLRVFLKNETKWIVNMAPCEKPRVAVAWPLPPTYQLINRFERPYNALRLLGCQTTVEILVFPMGRNFWQYCKANGISFLRAWKLIPFAVLVENLSSDVCFAVFVGSPFTGVFLAQEFQGGFFDDFWQQRLSHLHCQDLSYVHEQVEGLLQVPGPLASTPHHPIDRACKFDSHAFCPQPHHPLRSIYNMTTPRNIYIPPPHTIQSVTPTMFASSMNVNIPPTPSIA